jgi:hypothetical protein
MPAQNEEYWAALLLHVTDGCVQVPVTYVNLLEDWTA